MKLFHSPLTMALLIASVALALIGAGAKKGHALPFWAAITAAGACTSALLADAAWQEVLLYLLLVLLAGRRWRA